MKMYRLWNCLALVIFFQFSYAQKSFQFAKTLEHYSGYNDVVTLSDESFLVVLNRSRGDSSYIELWKLGQNGDTLALKQINFGSYWANASVHSHGNSLVLGVALADDCPAQSANYGFAFVELSIGLQELSRSYYWDAKLSKLPAGTMRFSGNQYYLFHQEGVHIFDQDYQILHLIQGLDIRDYISLEVFNQHILGVKYNQGLFVYADSGQLVRHIDRKDIQGLAVTDTSFYTGVSDDIYRWNSNLEVVDSAELHGYYYAFFSTASFLHIHQDELIVISDNRGAFLRIDIPSFKTKLSSHSRLPAMNYRYFLLNRMALVPFANSSVVGVLYSDSIWDVVGTSVPGMDEPYHMLYLEYRHPDQKPRRGIDLSGVDSLWIDTLSRFPHYAANEFNVDIYVKVRVWGDTARQMDILLDANMGNKCNGNAQVLKRVSGMELAGEDSVLVFKNIKLESAGSLESFPLHIAGFITSQNQRAIAFPSWYGYDIKTIRMADMVERPAPVNPDDATDSLNLRMYPNLTENFIGFKGKLHAGAEFRIYDLTGKVVYTETLSATANEHEIKVQHLAPSPYLIHVKDLNKDKTYRFVKM